MGKPCPSLPAFVPAFVCPILHRQMRVGGTDKCGVGKMRICLSHPAFVPAFVSCHSRHSCDHVCWCLIFFFNNDSSHHAVTFQSCMALKQLSSGLFATQRHFSPVVALKQLSLGFIWAVICYTETLQSCVAPEQLSLGFMNSSHHAVTFQSCMALKQLSLGFMIPSNCKGDLG